MDTITKEFWQKWEDANEINKLRLVETLTMPSPVIQGDLYYHTCVSLVNSYLVDLRNYLSIVWLDPLDPRSALFLEDN